MAAAPITVNAKNTASALRKTQRALLAVQKDMEKAQEKMAAAIAAQTEQLEAVEDALNGDAPATSPVRQRGEKATAAAPATKRRAKVVEEEEEEPVPTKKRRARVVEEEEEEPVPTKKRRVKVAEEEEERPAKKRVRSDVDVPKKRKAVRVVEEEDEDDEDFE